MSLFGKSTFPFESCKGCSGFRSETQDIEGDEQVAMYCKLTVQERIKRKIECPAYTPNERRLAELVWSSTTTGVGTSKVDITSVHIPISPTPSRRYTQRSFCFVTREPCTHHFTDDEKRSLCLFGNATRVRRPEFDKTQQLSGTAKPVKVRGFGTAIAVSMPVCPKDGRLNKAFINGEDREKRRVVRYKPSQERNK